MFVPAIVAYIVMRLNPDAAPYAMSPVMIDLIKSGTKWWKDLNTFNEIGSAVIMTHNLSVSFLAYTGGMTFGLLRSMH